jgi:hypothetical protein
MRECSAVQYSAVPWVPWSWAASSPPYWIRIVRDRHSWQQHSSSPKAPRTVPCSVLLCKVLLSIDQSINRLHVCVCVWHTTFERIFRNATFCLVLLDCIEQLNHWSMNPMVSACRERFVRSIKMTMMMMMMMMKMMMCLQQTSSCCQTCQLLFKIAWTVLFDCVVITVGKHFTTCINHSKSKSMRCTTLSADHHYDISLSRSRSQLSH